MCKKELSGETVMGDSQIIGGRYLVNPKLFQYNIHKYIRHCQQCIIANNVCVCVVGDVCRLIHAFTCLLCFG